MDIVGRLTRMATITAAVILTTIGVLWLIISLERPIHAWRPIMPLASAALLIRSVKHERVHRRVLASRRSWVDVDLVCRFSGPVGEVYPMTAVKPIYDGNIMINFEEWSKDQQRQMPLFYEWIYMIHGTPENLFNPSHWYADRVARNAIHGYDVESVFPSGS